MLSWGRDEAVLTPACPLLSFSCLGKTGFEFHLFTRGTPFCTELAAFFHSQSLRIKFVVLSFLASAHVHV